MTVVNFAAEPNVVCLLTPEGADERTISRGWGSQSIIGLEQYRLMKKYSGISSLHLYDETAPVGRNDVLLVMMCLPVVRYETLQKFDKVVYYFDDMNSRKAPREEYAQKLAKVTAYIAPLKYVADDMNSAEIKKSFYMPWSMIDVDYEIVKSERPSVFIDMDEREFAKISIERGYEFARLCISLGMSAYVFDKFVDQCPDDLKDRVTYVSRMAPQDFRKLLSQMWFYASGIKSSYEYCVLETAMLGCGLISIHSALAEEHLQRPFCLMFNSQEGFAEDLRKAVSSFDKDAIIAAAKRLYPQDTSKALKGILAEILSSAPG